MTPFAAALLMIVSSFPVFHRDLKTETPEDRQARLGRYSVALDRATLRATCQGEWAYPECKPIWRGSREDLALQLAMLSFQESRNSREVQAGECRKNECDPQTKNGEVTHLARTGWQLHKQARITEEWDLMVGTSQENLDAAAWAAAKVWVSSYWTCGGTVAGGTAAYAGQGKTCQWEGSARRVNFYKMIRPRWEKAYREALAQEQATPSKVAPTELDQHLATNP